MLRTSLSLALLCAGLFGVTSSLASASVHHGAEAMFALNNVKGTPKYKKSSNSRLEFYYISGRSSTSVTIRSIPASLSGSWGGGSPNFNVPISFGDLKTLFAAGCTGFRITNNSGDADEVGFPAMHN